MYMTSLPVSRVPQADPVVEKLIERARAAQRLFEDWNEPRIDALLLALSSTRRMESPLAEDIGSSRHSHEDLTQPDGSELNSIDEIFAGLASAHFFEF